MNEREINKRLYTPLAQKTGIFFNYKSMLWIFPLWILAHTFLIMHGLLFDTLYYNTQLALLLIQLTIYPIMYALFCWIYRTTVLGTNDLLSKEKGFENIFLNYDEHKKFQDSFYKLAYSKKEFIIIIPVAIIILLDYMNFFYATSVYSALYIVGYLLRGFIYISMLIAAASVLYYYISVFYIFFKFVEEKE